jgi:hypothetical protein
MIRSSSALSVICCKAVTPALAGVRADHVEPRR